jgi:excisionase family DNA binding protein
MDRMTTNPLLLSIPEAAAACALGKSKFYELIAAGEIRVLKIGRRTLVSRRELETFVERLECRAAESEAGEVP